jgi:hypothetical protein
MPVSGALSVEHSDPHADQDSGCVVLADQVEDTSTKPHAIQDPGCFIVTHQVEDTSTEPISVTLTTSAGVTIPDAIYLTGAVRQ